MLPLLAASALAAQPIPEVDALALGQPLPASAGYLCIPNRDCRKAVRAFDQDLVAIVNRCGDLVQEVRLEAYLMTDAQYAGTKAGVEAGQLEAWRLWGLQGTPDPHAAAAKVTTELAAALVALEQPPGEPAEMPDPGGVPGVSGVSSKRPLPAVDGEDRRLFQLLGRTDLQVTAPQLVPQLGPELKHAIVTVHRRRTTPCRK